MVDSILFVFCPYVALALAVGLGAFRYAKDRAAFSSFSSQLLEKEALHRGSPAWHYGILIVLLAHALALLLPRFWRLLGGTPPRLWGLEMSGLVLALFSLVGLSILIMRRLVNARVRRVTSVFDWVLLAVLFLQVSAGFLVALLYRWGSQWYLATVVPWIASLFSLRPDTTAIARLPWLAKAHFFGGIVLVALFPFGRLLHLATSRLSYLFRPYQMVIWNRARGSDARQPDERLP
jgi:nitrate reductase gamma subunit